MNNTVSSRKSNGIVRARLIESATLVRCEANGHGRGDGYDFEVWKLNSGRYLAIVTDVATGYTSHYIAMGREDALAVGRHCYSPGAAPGNYNYIKELWRLAEARGQK